MEIQTGFIGSFLYFLLRVSCFIQESAGKIFWWVLIKPALLFSKLINAENSIPAAQRRTDSKTFVVLDTLMPVHRCLWKYLKCMFHVSAAINGNVTNWKYFDALLKWNKQIPLLGYEKEKTTFSIQLLLKVLEDGKSRGCDIVWLSTNAFVGTFQIVSKELVPSNKGEEVVIKGIWTSGEHSGKVFTLKRTPAYREANDGPLPIAIYQPPRFVIFALEGFISASAVLALMEASKGGWPLVKEPLTKALEWFGASISGLTSWVQRIWPW